MATTIASASPSSRGNSAPVRPDSTMYAAQNAPAARARAMPTHSSSSSGVLSASEMSTTPSPAATTATASTHRRDSTAARVSGPMNSMVTATPIGRCASEL